MPVRAARKNRTNLVVFQFLFVSERMNVSPNDYVVRIFWGAPYMLEQEAVCFWYIGVVQAGPHAPLGVCMHHTPQALFLPLAWFVCAFCVCVVYFGCARYMLNRIISVRHLSTGAPLEYRGRLRPFLAPLKMLERILAAMVG